LPLLEEPVSLSSDEDDDGGADADERQRKLRGAPLLSMDQLWGSHERAEESDPEGPLPGPALPSAQLAAVVTAAAGNEVAAEALDDDEGADVDAREMERTLSRMLAEGRSLEELSGLRGVSVVRGADINADVRARQLARAREDDEVALRSTGLAQGFAGVDKNKVSVSMKRSNQLTALALAAQRSAGELEVKLAKK
jgi:hypothetical protein